MPRSQMLTAVALATLIGAASQLCYDRLMPRAKNRFDPDWEPFFFTSFTRQDYWLKYVPKLVVSLAVINCPRYWWYIWLERILPTRPRWKSEVVPDRSQLKDTDSQEEKIVADWIAQGRIRRSSISWCNVFGKVLLDITVGNLVWHAMHQLLDRLTGLREVETFFEEFLLDVGGTAGVYMFSLVPPVPFLAFIVAPAHQRIVFEDGVYFICTIFIALFLGQLGPWLMSNDTFREAWYNGSRLHLDAANVTSGNMTFHSMEEL